MKFYKEFEGGIMKRIFQYILLIVFVNSMTGLLAQEDLWMDANPERRERLKTLRIWKMTEFLDLSSEQSTAFFPKLKDFEKYIRSKQKKQRELIQEITEKINESDYSPKRSDVKKLIHQLAEIEKDIINQKEEFINDLSTVLTPEQQLQYIVFENRFRRKLMKTLNQQARQKRLNQERRRK